MNNKVENKHDLEFDESEGSVIYKAADKYVFEDNGHKWSNNSVIKS